MYAVEGPGGLGQAAHFGYPTSPWGVEVHGKSSPGEGPFSLSAWFKTSFKIGRLTVMEGLDNSTGDKVLLGIVAGVPHMLLRDPGSDPSGILVSHWTGMADDQWHHLAVTFSGGGDDTLRLFVDGRLSDAQAQPTGAVDTSFWSVAMPVDGTDYFAGPLDDVRMYARKLSDGGVSQVGDPAGGDVAELYAMGIPEPGTLVLLLAAGAAALLLWRRRLR